MTSSMMTTTPEISFRLPAAVRRDDASDCFVSYCAPLDLYSAGKTRRDAVEAIASAIKMFVRNCFERKVLDNFLVERGFHADRHDGERPGNGQEWFIALQRFGGEQHSVDVSFPLSMGVRATGTQACPL